MESSSAAPLASAIYEYPSLQLGGRHCPPLYPLSYIIPHIQRTTSILVSIHPSHNLSRPRTARPLYAIASGMPQERKKVPQRTKITYPTVGYGEHLQFWFRDT